MKTPLLDDRLQSVAQQVRQDAVFADIGTDHAYLPIFLLCTGKISRAVCTDIHKGPLATARKNAAAYGVLDRADFLLTDGTRGVENYPVTDLAVCGMGGEMIADILAATDKKLLTGTRFILQPMSKQETLRQSLGTLGFAVDAETYSADGNKYYLTLTAHYDGTPRTLTLEEAAFGTEPEAHLQEPAFLGYLSAKRRAWQTAKGGKGEAGLPTDEEERLLTALFALLNRREKRS